MKERLSKIFLNQTSTILRAIDEDSASLFSSQSNSPKTYEPDVLIDFIDFLTNNDIKNSQIDKSVIYDIIKFTYSSESPYTDKKLLHDYLKPMFDDYSLYEIALMNSLLVKKKTDDLFNNKHIAVFKDLVSFGITNKFFEYAQKEFLSTNSTRQKILEEAIKPPEFSISKLKELSEKNHKDSNNKENLMQYIYQYFDKVYPEIDCSSPKYNSIQENVKKTLLHFIAQVPPEEKIEKRNEYLIKNIVKTPYSEINGYNSTLKILLKNNREIVYDCIEKIFEEHQEKIYGSMPQGAIIHKKLTNTNFFIEKITKEIGDGEYLPLPEHFSKTIQLIMDTQRKTIVNGDGYSIILNFLTAKFIKKLENEQITDEEKETHLKNILKVYCANSEHIVYQFHQDCSSYLNLSHSVEVVINMEKNLEKLKGHQKDLNLPNSFFETLDKIKYNAVAKICDKYYEYLNQHNQATDYASEIISIVEFTGITEPFVRNDLNKTFMKNYKQGRYGSRYTEASTLFYILERITGQFSNSWQYLKEQNFNILNYLFSNPESIEMLSTHQFKNKTIIDTILNLEQKKNSFALKLIFENKKTTEALVINNPKNLKKIKKAVENGEIEKEIAEKINTTIQYYDMLRKTNSTDEKKPTKSLKI